MKQLVFLALVCICSVFGQDQVTWEVKDNENQTCIKMDLLFMKEKGFELKHDGLKQILSDGTLNKAKSKCEDKTGNVVVDYSTSVNATLSFIFTKDGEQVKITGLILYNHNNTVRSLNLSPATLSNVKRSYICDNTTWDFDGIHDDSAQMNVQQIQVQAFNIVNNSFSESENCIASASSIGPGFSTEATPTTEMPVTTVKPSKETFKLEDGNETCIIMTGIQTIEVKYTKTDNSTKMVSFGVPQNASVGGSCPKNASESRNIELSWKSGELENKVTYSFSISNDMVELNIIEITIQLDETNFPNASKPNMTESKEVNKTLSKSDTFYQCMASQDIPAGTITLTLSELQVQAFGVTGDKFTGKGNVCSKDSTTTPMPTTTAIPNGKPPVNTLLDYQNPCVLVKAGIQFNIEYENTKNESKTIVIPVPENVTVTTNCNATTAIQQMELSFYKAWKLFLSFTSSGSKAELAATASKVDSFYLSQVLLDYDLKEFVKDIDKSTGSMVANISDAKYKANGDGSYMCSSKISLDFNKAENSMDTFDLQFMAFTSQNSTKFPDNGVSECSADSTTSSVVPIAVGAALAGLVIVVLIAYLIGRKRSRGGYEQV